MSDVTVIGAGSWGTAMAWLLGQEGHTVRLWARRPELAEAISNSRANPVYLPAAELPPSVSATADLGAALVGARLVLVIVPSVGLPTVARQMAELIEPGAMVVSLTKGLEQPTGRRMSAVLAAELPETVLIGALSGPNLAGEIVQGQPAAAVLGSTAESLLQEAQRVLCCTLFRVYTNRDLPGVELGGALKNPYAIAAGIVDGLGFGDNTKAALMTRGMHEMTRLGVALGADARTFAGLCGFGDLLATCHSRQSRNRNLGEKLGQGLKLADILQHSAQVAEGVPTTRTALRLAQEHGVKMPILSELGEILSDGKTAAEAVVSLMGRRFSDEFE